MFLLSKQQWDKCFGSLKEDELMSSEHFDFTRFKKEYDKFFHDTINYSENLNDFYTDQFLNQLPYLNECYDKNLIKYIGKGSSRIVFAFSDGKAIKCALNNAGIAQNKTEIENTSNTVNKYNCFPSIYNYNDKYLYLITDCCRKITINDLYAFFDNLGFKDFIEFIKFIVKLLENNDIKNKSNLTVNMLINISILEYQKLIKSKIEIEKNKIKEYMQNSKYNSEKISNLMHIRKEDIKTLNNKYKDFINFAKAIIANNRESEKSIYSLIQFYINNSSQKLLFGDLKRDENWGILRRNNHDAPVIIDAGFSNYVYKTYYK